MEVATGSRSFIAGVPYQAKDFSAYSSESLLLHIHISSSQIDYMIAEAKSHRVLYVQPYQSVLNSIVPFLTSVLESDEVLLHFKGRKQIRILTSDFTIIPKDFSDNKLKEAWRKHFTKNEGHTILHYEKPESLDAEVVYSVSQHVMDQLRNSFKDFNLHHSISQQLTNLSLSNTGQAVYCNIQSGYLQLIYLREHQLIFANVFAYQSSEDFIYFLLAVYKQLQLNPEYVKIILLGEIVKDSSLFHLVYKYIRHIEFGKAAEQWKFNDDYPFPNHFYYSLFC